MSLTLPLIFCLIVTVIPVFFGKISSAPTWLSLQALALGWITLNNAGEISAHTALSDSRCCWCAPYWFRSCCAGHSGNRRIRE